VKAINSNRDAQKTRRIRQAMEKQGYDALLLRLPENVTYASGYWPLGGISFVVFPRDQEPTFIGHNFEPPPGTWITDIRSYVCESLQEIADPVRNSSKTVAEVLREKRLDKCKLGLELSAEAIGGTYLKWRSSGISKYTTDSLARELPNCTFDDAMPMLYEIRSRKTEQEVDKLRIANKVARYGLEVFEEGLVEGKTEGELAAEIETATVTEGLRHVKKASHIMPCAFLVSGKETANAHGWVYGNGRRRLRKGDLAMLEFDVIVDGYCSDTTRTFTVGKAAMRQRALLEAVKEAHDEAIESIKPGITCSKVADIAHTVIEKNGYGKFLKHYVGHGLGVTIWEPIPSLHPASQGKLMPGMVHSIEPGVYVKGFGGVRTEDNVLDTSSGTELLSNYPYFLD